MIDAYLDFLKSKIRLSDKVGLDNARPWEGLYPHQSEAVAWAAGLGKALIAMSFGLGKTRIQCDLARLIHEHTGKPFMVICPLGVKHQFSHEDGPVMGVRWQYVRNDAEALAADTPYLLTTTMSRGCGRV